MQGNSNKSPQRPDLRQPNPDKPKAPPPLTEQPGEPLPAIPKAVGRPMRKRLDS